MLVIIQKIRKQTASQYMQVQQMRHAFSQPVLVYIQKEVCVCVCVCVDRWIQSPTTHSFYKTTKSTLCLSKRQTLMKVLSEQSSRDMHVHTHTHTHTDQLKMFGDVDHTKRRQY
jgi:hypothetical protein